MQNNTLVTLQQLYHFVENNALNQCENEELVIQYLKHIDNKQTDQNIITTLLNQHHLLLNQNTFQLYLDLFFKEDVALRAKEELLDLIFQRKLDYHGDINLPREFIIILVDKVNLTELLSGSDLNFYHLIDICVFYGVSVNNALIDNAVKQIIESHGNIGYQDQLMSYLSSLKDWGDYINSQNADNYLKFISFLSPTQEEKNLNIRFALIEELIKNGVDVNKAESSLSRRSSVTILDYIVGREENIPIMKFLIENGARCGPDAWRSEKLFQEYSFYKYDMQIVDISNKISYSLTAPAANEPKIPYIYHHIWFTSFEQPREILDISVQIAMQSKSICNDDIGPWRHILWTNDKSLIPNTTRKFLDQGFEVLSISDYANQTTLYNELIDKIDHKEWGMASDIWRYEIVRMMGGVYSDLNFHLSRSIEKELYRYDYFAANFINNFFAATPNHPILVEIIDLVAKRLNKNDLHFTAGEVFSETIFTTLLPFALGFLRAANQGDNKDVLFSSIDLLEEDFTLGEEKIDYNRCHANYFWELLMFTGKFEICIDPSRQIGLDDFNESLTWLG
jgi:hypothetical protein